MKHLHVVGYSVLVLLLMATLLWHAVANGRLLNEKQIATYRLQWIEDTARRLSQGEGNLFVYSMKETDQLLVCFANRTDIQKVGLEMTDVGATGIEAIASLPNVRSISFSGVFGVNDETLPRLTKCERLETLELTSTKVTDDGVARFRSQMPRCKVQFNGEKF